MKFDTYLKYKDIETVWLDKIPDEWHIDRMKNIGTVRGRVGWKALKASEYVDKSEYIFIATPNIKYKDIDFKNVNYLTKERYDESPEIMLKKDDVVLTKDGSTLGTVNIIKYLPSFTTVNSSIAVLRFKSVNSKFMHYQIKSEYIQNIVKLKKDGAGVPHLFQKDINDFQMLLPDISIQDKLVRYLDSNIDKLDDAIILLEQRIQKYKELKQTLIKETVLRGLDKSVELQDSQTPWIGNIPKSWTTERLKNIFDERVGKNLDKETGEAVTANILSVMKDIGVINHRDKGNVGNKMAEDITNYKLVHPNDIVVNKMNIMIGSVGISKEFGALSVIYIILITKKDSYAKYYDYFFKMKAFQRSLRRIATGILEIREAVNMTLFMQEAMTVPPYEEQVDIANYLDEKTTKIDEIVKALGTKIDTLKEFRKTLINDVVTGKVKVA